MTSFGGDRQGGETEMGSGTREGCYPCVCRLPLRSIGRTVYGRHREPWKVPSTNEGIEGKISESKDSSRYYKKRLKGSDRVMNQEQTPYIPAVLSGRLLFLFIILLSTSYK